MICKKCKLTMMTPNEERISIDLGEKGKAKRSGLMALYSLDFCVFKSYDDSIPIFSKILSRIKFDFKKLKIPSFEEDLEFESNLEPFYNLKNIILRMLFNELVSQSQLDLLTGLEADLLLLFCKMKKLFNFENIRLTAEYFKEVRENPSHKTKEENLKFVFKKAFKFLKVKFNECASFEDHLFLKPSIGKLDKTSKKEYMFTAFYFQRQAIEMGICLENFMQPTMTRNFAILNGESAPKSVNKRYVERIRENVMFRQHLRGYLTLQMVNEAKIQAIKKTEEIILKWEEIYLEKGSTFLRRRVSEQYSNNAKTKLPWSVSQIQFSVDQVLGLIQ